MLPSLSPKWDSRAPNEHDQGKDRMEIDESDGGLEGVGDGAEAAAACPCIPGPRGPSSAPVLIMSMIKPTKRRPCNQLPAMSL